MILLIARAGNRTRDFKFVCIHSSAKPKRATPWPVTNGLANLPQAHQGSPLVTASNYCIVSDPWTNVAQLIFLATESLGI